MMKKFFLLGLLTLALSASLSAALPPFAQSKREMISILNSNELSKYFNSSDILQSIKHSGENSYTVSAKNKEVVVDVVYKTTDEKRIGPLEFDLIFHPTNLP